MRPLNLREISTDMLHNDSGIANFSWISIAFAILLLFAMIKLEGLIYCCTGGGFLLP